MVSAIYKFYKKYIFGINRNGIAINILHFYQRFREICIVGVTTNF